MTKLIMCKIQYGNILSNIKYTKYSNLGMPRTRRVAQARGGFYSRTRPNLPGQDFSYISPIRFLGGFQVGVGRVSGSGYTTLFREI